MNSHTKSLRLYLYLYFVAVITCATLRTVSLISFFDFTLQYYDSSALISVTNGVAVVIILLCASYIFAGSRKPLNASFSSPATYVPTGIVATSMIFVLQELLRARADRIVSGIATITAVLGCLSVIHFFLNAFMTEERTRLRAGVAIATVAFLSAYAAFIYFSSPLPFNSPNKVLDEMAYLFCALFFLYEARISLGRSIWHGYVAFGLVSGIIASYSAIPTIITYFVTGNCVSLSIEESLLTLCLFIFITMRLILTLSLTDAGESKAIKAMEIYAERRQKIVSDAERIRPEIYAVQMTFDDLVREEGEDQIHLLGEDEEQRREDEPIEDAPKYEDGPHKESSEPQEQIAPDDEEEQISMDIIEMEPLGAESPEKALASDKDEGDPEE